MEGTKKEQISKEDKLKQDMVPQEEQPYSIPSNWVWTKIKYGFDVSSSKRVHKKDWKEKGIPFYRTRELVVLSEKGYVNNELYIAEEMYEEFKENFGVPQENDILLSGVGTIGVPFIVQGNNKFYFKDGNIIWFKNKGIFHSKYVYYLYKSIFLRNQLKALSSGTTVDTYTIVNATNTIVPLPPFPEQKRIVDRIESLFAKLDQAKELAQNALDTFETRKAAILHKAFTGELTAKWRGENGVRVDSWVNIPLGDVCNSLQYGTSKKSIKEGNVIVVRMGNLQDGEIDWDNLAYTGDEDDIQKYILSPGDVLFNRTNSPELVGKTAIYRGDFPAIFAGYLIRLNYDKGRLNGDYLNFAMNSPVAREYYNKVKSDGVNQSNINAKKIAAFLLPVPSIAEQEEIVRILNLVFTRESKVKEKLEHSSEMIEIIKKAILARAFRGELGTNNPNEESAVQLLKECLE